MEKILAKYSTIFDEKLGCYPHKKIKLDISPDAQPIRKRPYPIPYRQEHAFKKGVEERDDNGVLRRKHGGSEWPSPTFVVPKKDKRISVVSDFREVNKLIRRKPYPMPKIHESIQKRSEYTHFTKMDLSMQFYCFKLRPRTAHGPF